MGRELSKAHREMKNYRQLMTAERESVSLGAVLLPPPPVGIQTQAVTCVQPH